MFEKVLGEKMEQSEYSRRLEEGLLESRRFLGTPRGVAPLPEQEDFSWWGNIIDFYGMEKIQEFFINMFNRENYRKRPTTIDPRYGKDNMRIIKDILEE